ncbi:Crp/Fnr family transcriptional regulator [Alteraurantiacibacter buctensis]|uniref:Cyclic nucleotide-binding domain-containing protein n=1 Tax=Alteraurantiacibacter buctensis TaxID=1503981 RepID=A0A844YY23_9SPHN|nr:Crp/Fnr family transcriptional regulator [Alteraurantiacibacter buctensis]MXO72459.1 cyclic nucleotide-binding domain-containing protein [Alteraurantiacibacter buctensis]
MALTAWALPLAVLGGLLLLAAFLVRARRWLHLLAAMGFASLLCAGAAADAGVTTVGAAVLLTVNLIQFARLSRRLRQGALTAEERALIAEVLAIEEPAKQRRLRDVITWRDADTGEVLMRQGQKAPPLIYVATGQIAIEHEGLPVGTCGPDDFLGEMSLVTGEGASATVKVALPARIAVFDREALANLMAAMPELGRAFERRLNKGLADKIQRMNRASSGASSGAGATR